MPDVPAYIVDPFHKALYERIVTALDTRIVQVANGAARTYDEYKQHVGYISAMNDVLVMSRDIERERYGGSADQLVP